MGRKKGKYGKYDVYYTNEHGVTFSRGEIKRLNRAVSSANDIIALESSVRDQRRTVLKKDTAFYTPRHNDLSKFYSRKGFETYVRESERIARGTYYRHVAKAYRDNYISAIQRTTGSYGDPLIRKIKRLSLGEFRELVENDEIEELSYYYNDNEKIAAVEKSIQGINSALGIRSHRGRPRKDEKI